MNIINGNIIGQLKKTVYWTNNQNFFRFFFLLALLIVYLRRQYINDEEYIPWWQLMQFSIALVTNKRSTIRVNEGHISIFKNFMWINQMRPCNDLSSWSLIRILLFRSKNQCIPHLCLQKLVILPLSCSVSKSYTNELRVVSSVFRCYFFNIEIYGIGCHIFHLSSSS